MVDSLKIAESDLLTILNYWSFWDKRPPRFIKREVNLPKPLANIALVVQGVRRCGKSTLLIQYLSHFGIPPRNATFVNFEDPKLSDVLNYKLLDAIVEIGHKRKIEGKEHYFFLDEIQHVEGWERWLHSRLERPKSDHFIITGSNFSLLSGELSTVLTGRHITIELFPFSFKEISENQPRLTVDNYLKNGGFPQPVLENLGERLLKEYFDDILERDVRKRIHGRSIKDLRSTIKIVYEACGSELSSRKIAGTLGISTDTVSSYLDASEKAYLICRCPYFAYSEKQQTARQKKYYAIDTGLRRAVITKSGQDRGKDFENMVYLHLRRKYKEIYYWKGKGEVDFVAIDNDGVVPIQVSYDSMKDRHLTALDEFYFTFPQSKEAVLINSDNVKEFLKS